MSLSRAPSKNAPTASTPYMRALYPSDSSNSSNGVVVPRTTYVVSRTSTVMNPGSTNATKISNAVPVAGATPRFYQALGMVQSAAMGCSAGRHPAQLAVSGTPSGRSPASERASATDSART